MDRRFLHNSPSPISADATSYGEAPAALIGRPLRADSLIGGSPEKPENARDHLPHEPCCGSSKLMETATGSQRKHASIRRAANMGDFPKHDGGERRREKMKRFVADKGPRIAGAAAAFGMFIFNVVTSCS